MTAEDDYRSGNALMAEGRSSEAEAAYRAAIAANPAHAGAHNNLGNALRALGRHEDAIESYQAALALRPEFYGTLDNIAATLLTLHRPEDAEDFARRALAANPDFPPALNNLGGTLLMLGRYEEAIPPFRRAAAGDPSLVQARFGEALALLTLGDFRAGWRAYESRWDDPNFRVDVPDYTTPIWDGGGHIAGRTILLHCEQGLGDTLQFLRYVPLVRRRGARVILQVQSALAPLLSGFADEIVPQAGEARDDPVPPHELRCPLMSLPNAFGTRLATIPADVPYIVPNAARVAAWKSRLGRHDRWRVGLAFSGSAEHHDDALRSIPAARLLASLADTGADLHVVQTDIRPQDAAALATDPEAQVHAHALTDFTETAALLANLDEIVTVDTSIAHLAGAMGKPVRILLQHAGDFRWLRHRSDSPWYPTARLYRQPIRGEWATPLTSVSADIAAAAARFRPSSGPA